MNTNYTGANMAPLSKLDDYEVADGSVDVRGWKVIGSAGADIGKVDDLIVDASKMQARYLLVALDTDLRRNTSGLNPAEPVLVPVDRARIDDDHKRVHLDSSGARLAELPRYRGDAVDRDYNDRFRAAEASETTESETHRLTRSAEELKIGKRTVAAGEVKVSKHVEKERVKQPVTRTREEVTVERRPVTPGSGHRAEMKNEEFRVPITEEQIVVDKRPVVKEELVIGKRQVEETQMVDTELERERVDVEGERGREQYTDKTKTRKER